MREICSKLKIKTPDQRCSVVLIVNFQQILHTDVSFAESEQVDVS